ncbi:MAG: hypothetical protein QXW45_06750 [Thermosphaera sp.]
MSVVTLSLTVNVFNVDRIPLPASGGYIGVALFNSSYGLLAEKTVPYSGGASYVSIVFSNLTPGSYIIEVYHSPSVSGLVSEFWGGARVDVFSSTVFNFTRGSPYLGASYPYGGLTLYPGVVSPYAVVRNPGSSSAGSMVNLRVVGPSGSVIYNVNSSSASVPAGGSFNFTLSSLNLSSTGSYRFIYTVYLFTNNKWVVTDQAVFDVSVVTLSLTDEIIKIRIFSEYAGVFYYGIDFYNKFYVGIVSSEAPIEVSGSLVNYSLSFTYNDSIRMWESVFNMGLLPPGNHTLHVRACMRDGRVYEASIDLEVLEPPKLILEIVRFIQSTVELPVELDIVAKVNVSLIPLENRLYEKPYVLRVRIGLEMPLLRHEESSTSNIFASHMSVISFPLNLIADLKSDGVVIIGGEAGIVIEKEMVLMNTELRFIMVMNALGGIEIYPKSNITRGLLGIDVRLIGDLSRDIPTPLGVKIRIPGTDIEFQLGLTMTLMVSAESRLKLVFSQPDEPEQYLFGAIPLALSEVDGAIILPFAVSATIGLEAVGVGLRGFVYGGATLGIFLYGDPRPVRGYAIVGYIAGGFKVDLIVIRREFNSVIYKGSYTAGNISENDLSELISSLNEFLTRFGYPPIGEDWVNGSWIGIVQENIPFGHSFSVVEVGSQIYIYYVSYGQNQTIKIDGMVFSGLNAINASIPAINKDYTASPYLFKTKDGRVGLIWIKVFSQGNALDDLQLIPQISFMVNGVWSDPRNITGNGITISLASDGEMIYILRAPVMGANISQIYQNMILEVYDLEGNLIRQILMSNAIGILDAYNGTVLVEFINGTKALISSDYIQYFNAGERVGFLKELGAFYIVLNGSLIITGDHQIKNITINGTPYYVRPIYINGKLLVITCEPGKLKIHVLEDEKLLVLREYMLSNVSSVKYAFTNEYVYLFPYIVHNDVNSTIMGIIIPIKPPTPSLETVFESGKLHVFWRVNASEEYNITRVILRICKDEVMCMEENVTLVGYNSFFINQTGTYHVYLIVESILGYSESHQVVSVGEVQQTQTSTALDHTKTSPFNATSTEALSHESLTIIVLLIILFSAIFMLFYLLHTERRGF